MKRAYGKSCFKSMMVSEHDDNDDDDSSAKCRERRRRRMAMRRMAAAGASSSSIKVEEKHNRTTAKTTISDMPVTAIMNLISIMEPTPPPVYGTMSVIGRQREMEDEVSVRTSLCRPEVNGFRPVHFFGVFDGHGGRHVSTLCKEYMHVIMEEELMHVNVEGDVVNGGVGGRYMELWRTAIERSFQRMDEMVLRMCVCGGTGSSLNRCSCNPKMCFMGSTAVVSLLTKEHVFVANCGDSRAVLCRNGRPIPLSIDHKADREDERARIEGCGGKIIYSNGARVEGLLAVSRAIGDRLLKKWVISEPEISITKREAGDEFLILASDGLWDVLSSELACNIVHECLIQNNNSSVGPSVSEEGVYPSRSESAATLLVRLALGRKSTDNISVVVLDLK